MNSFKWRYSVNITINDNQAPMGFNQASGNVLLIDGCGSLINEHQFKQLSFEL